MSELRWKPIELSDRDREWMEWQEQVQMEVFGWTPAQMEARKRQAEIEMQELQMWIRMMYLKCIGAL